MANIFLSDFSRAGAIEGCKEHQKLLVRTTDHPAPENQPVMTSLTNGLGKSTSKNRTSNGNVTRPTVWPVSNPLDRLVVVLEDKTRMRVSLSCQDMTGVILFLSQSAFQEGLNIDEVFGERLQEDQHGSFFIITGDPDGIERLRHRLTNGPLVHEGTMIRPDKIFDMSLGGPDRKGIMFDVCQVLTDHDINIINLKSRVRSKDDVSDGGDYSDCWLDISEDELDTSDVEWMVDMHFRFEVSQDHVRDLPRIKQQILEKLESTPLDDGRVPHPGEFDVDYRPYQRKVPTKSGDRKGGSRTNFQN